VVPGSDRAPEHVPEQQDEHDRLHTREEDGLRHPRVSNEVALVIVHMSAIAQ